MVKLIYVVFFIVVLKANDGLKLDPPACDYSRRLVPKEGLLGSVSHFPWLGVLRVHLHHETSLKIALTGIVLVKENYAIGNADDIVRIPKRIFQEDSRAMFIPAERAPWFCRPVDYVTHPEYEFETLNSIAVIELAPPEDTKFPMRPVCWPPYSYNTSNNLYAVGYTDDNQLLEKFIYRLQYVEKDLCKEFYNRAGLTEKDMAPKHYVCGFAQNNTDTCVWDNGMALVSNSSGRWVLVGLGLQGPGCAAPARFISLADYYPWIELAVEGDDGNYRKSAFNDGFKKRVPEVEYIPAHELLRSNSTALETRRQEDQDQTQYYPKGVPDRQVFHIDRINAAEIRINFAKYDYYREGIYGNCSDHNLSLIYKDYIDVMSKTSESPGVRGAVQYMITLLDPMFLNYTCVTLKLIVQQARPAYLFYDTITSGTNYFPETPEDIIRHYPFYTQTKLVKKDKKATFIQDPVKSSGDPIIGFNVNLYLKIIFQGNCRLEIKFFGPAVIFDPTVTSFFVTTEAQMVKKNITTTEDPYKKASFLRKNMPLEQKVLESKEVEIEPKGAVLSTANDNLVTVWFWLVVIFNLLF